ncbi:MAG: polysaccharide deacetylase family protein [Pseudomonadota bacterium]
MRLLARVLIAIGGMVQGVACAADSAVVLMYHRFGDARFPATNIRTEQLRGHLDFLQANGYHVIPLDRLVAALADGSPLPDKAVVITVDDAFRSVYEVGHPVFRDYGVPYTLFVSTDALDQALADYMSWDQLQELGRAGVTIANHGATHKSMLAGINVEADIRRGAEALARHVDPLDGVFAYPYGEFDEAVMASLSKLGYRFAFGQHSGAVGRGSAALALPRFPMNETYGALPDFGTKVSSKALPVTAVSPSDPAVSVSEPRITVELGAALQNEQLTCFVGGQGQVPVDWQASGTAFSVGPVRPLDPGRHRVNCTAPVGDGTYYWFSHPWFVAAR